MLSRIPESIRVCRVVTQEKNALSPCPLVYLNGLHRRIKRLERDLSIPKREQHDFSYLSLRKPNERTIHGGLLHDGVSGHRLY